jgi:hypothetical protein
MCGADDVRKGYKGCFADLNGPYTVPPWEGSSRMLPKALNTNGFTHEQCALAAAQAGYEVYAMQASGFCFMGTLVDVVQTKTKLDDSRCSTTPCLAGVGCFSLINKVYSLGTPCRCFSNAGTATDTLQPVEARAQDTASDVYVFTRQLGSERGGGEGEGEGEGGERERERERERQIDRETERDEKGGEREM